jgi:hypothetical protein
MKVFCHYRGGYEFGAIRLYHGENVVDDKLWNEAIAKLDPRLRDAWMGGKTPTIVVDKDPGHQVALPLAPAPAPAREAEPMLAKDVIAIVETATEPEQLEQLAEGETRKTVLAAIQRRAKQLAEAAA